ncbi:MBL fold metallo-hydrolase [Chitinophaga oryzae]|uniref:MBL fold metallo-hydrolase n=1 Tax=Chitinophaga oryzae TaxID=2725414 RepID=A0AAE6ZH34_9BACT|nr:MBL fold metallo-hydrolase [Chitinophaga oryzae]QJB32845.1 MBL fold metallo-hydrolase [Chitinophaga oryzae]QJB39298.1 MBL fold metallo-hydrolase [Chitinophaga oryzae]
MLSDTEQLVYLKPNVVIEPLFNKWYAWSHLISPATAAMNIVEKHLKIMDSYIQAPRTHAAAAKNPKLLGGPFMDYPTEKVAEIKQLKSHIEEISANSIVLHKAFRDLNSMLKSKAKGFNLSELYKEIPGPLQGYVELVYDLDNHPSYRIFESLLFNSEFYNKKSQTFALWVTDNDDRPFALSTPKLNDDNVLHADLPFESDIIDELSKMKRIPGSLEQIKNRFSLNEKDRALFDSFFTKAAPPVYQKYNGDKIRMRYFGHACILVETKEVTILVDPLISYYGYQSEVSRFSDMDLPDTIDYVFITHNHQDHLLFETLIPLRHKIRHIVVPGNSKGRLQDPSLRLMFNNIGFDNVIEIDDMDRICLDNCAITGLPFLGEHADLDIQSKLCYHVKIGDFAVIFAADSCILEQKVYEHVHRIVKDVDVLFLGMECDGAPLSWIYGPLLDARIEKDMDDSRRLSGSNFERGMKLVDVFNPKEVYVYAMGMEPWLKFISSIKYTAYSNPIIESGKLIDHCLERGITAERLFGEKELLRSN